MNRATHITISAFGILAGIAGIEHGIGEIRQGSVSPDGLIIESWPDSPFFENLSGEPALTIVPNLLVAGALAIIMSLCFIIWVTFFITRKHGGLVLSLISLVMLLVGAGFGPPILGFILGMAATKINAPLARWGAHTPESLRLLFSLLWPWTLGGGLAAFLLLVPGVPLFGYLAPDASDSNVVAVGVAILAPSAFGLLIISIIAAFSRDVQERAGSLTLVRP